MAEHLSFGRAAEALHTAQPSLSQQIRQLERELGARLFDRTKRYVALTEEGRRALPEARAILDRVDSLGETMQAATKTPSGPLRIGSITASTIGILPQVLPAYGERYPLVTFSVETLPIDEQLRALIERRIDVALLRGPIDDDRILVHPLVSEELFVALHFAHPLAERRRVSVSSLDGEHLITLPSERSGGFHAEMMSMVERHGARFAGTTTTPDLETCIALVACAMGISVVSSIARGLVVEGVVYRRLSPRTTVESLVLAWRRDRGDLPAVRSFIDLMRTQKFVLSD